MSVKTYNNKIKIFNATSGQFFGNNKKNHYNEKSSIDPQSPYGVAKAAGYMFTKIFRDNYNLYCCSGILFNHESTLRSNDFVTKQIINTSIKMKRNKKLKLYLGNIDVYRDFSDVRDVTDAYLSILFSDSNEQIYNVCSNTIHSIADIISFLNQECGYEMNVKQSRQFMRSNIVRSVKGDNSRLKALGWKKNHSFFNTLNIAKLVIKIAG